MQFHKKAMFSWLCCNQNVEKRQILEKVLPEKYHYRISTFKVLEESEIVHETKFEAVVAVNICSVDNIEQFLSDFQESSSTNYNILAGDKKGGKKTLKTGYRKCHHNVRKRTKSGEDTMCDDLTKGKQTNCPAGLTFKLKKNT